MGARFRPRGPARLAPERNAPEPFRAAWHTALSRHPLLQEVAAEGEELGTHLDVQRGGLGRVSVRPMPVPCHATFACKL